MRDQARTEICGVLTAAQAEEEGEGFEEMTVTVHFTLSSPSVQPAQPRPWIADKAANNEDTLQMKH